MDKHILDLIEKDIDEKLSIVEKINFHFSRDFDVEVHIKREDLIHPLISGNKWRKLKYNLIDNSKTYFTFGGAHSNHLFSMAAACKKMGFRCVGFIRGNELLDSSKWSKTLKFAFDCGMELVFLDRKEYRLKEKSNIVYLHVKENWIYIPEGGSNEIAIKGCEEICSERDFIDYDYICVCVGTGATAAGIINKSKGKGKILAFTVVNHPNMNDDILRFLKQEDIRNYEIVESHYGKYGIANNMVLKFITDFETETQIKLDKVYTGKMMYTLYEMILKGKFAPKTKILIIHTGGYQERWIV